MISVERRARGTLAIRSDAAYVPVAFAIEAATHQAFGVGLHLAKDTEASWHRENSGKMARDRKKRRLSDVL
jgi:hypothetical protein